jgi:hypothetical protein
VEADDPKYTYKISEQPANKDHRSFAANLFGTVAFRMLEWLTPQGVAAISSKLDVGDLELEQAQSPDTGSSESSSTTSKTDNATELTSPSKSPSLLNGEPPEKLTPPEPLNPSPRDPTKSRRTPEATFRSPQSSKPRRRASLEPPSPAKAEEPRSPTKSPRPNGFLPEKLGRTLKTNPAGLSRGIPEIPAKPAFFSSIPSQHDVLVDTADDDSGTQGEESSVPPSIHAIESPCKPRTEKLEKPGPRESATDPSAADISCPLPQSLTKVNVDIVDFVCDVFEEDNTGETSNDVDFSSRESYPKPRRGRTSLIRTKATHNVISRRQWKAFNEQTLFSVLSDPKCLISSFTTDCDLVDSHTLWYCMFRLTRAAPSLVFHSLWMAADSLFVPPKAIQGAVAKQPRTLGGHRDALTDSEAGCIMSICLHALAGSVPALPTKTSLRSLTSVRSTGLTLSTFADILVHDASLREEFDDAFSNEMAIRLARRLCCAITARRQFTWVADINWSTNEDVGITAHPNNPDPDPIDVLDGLFNQIDILGLETTPVLEFSEDSWLRHHGRMQLLTLEWARTVLFNSWDGHPDFRTRGPFAGALLLMKSLCKSLSRLY